MKHITALLLSCLMTTASFADNDWSDNLQVHGFASQAFVYTTDNNFYGDSDHGSVAFTELGLNASFQLSPSLRLAGQVLSRHAGEFDHGSPRIDYALIDATLISSSKGRAGVYLGRIKNPIGLYNDTRDVAHTRQGIFNAQTVYFDKVRELIMSSDGMQFYSEYLFSNGALLIQAGMGYPLPDKNVEHTYMGKDWAGNISGDELGLFGRVMYEHDGGRWIYAITGSQTTLDFNHGAADATPFGLSSGEIEIDYTILSAQYNGEKWQFTTEVALQHTSYNDISIAFDNAGFDSTAYYGQLDYKFTPQWQAFIRYEEIHLHDDWNGKKTAEKSIANSQFLADNYGIQQTPTPAHANYAKIWTVGGYWDIKNNFRIRTEYQLVEGTLTLSPRENNIPLSDKYWNLFAISLSYRF